MDGYIRYFKEVTYSPKYFLGDRVKGKYKGIPFVGSIAIDHKISEDVTPSVCVFLDLPLKHNNKWYTFIEVDHSKVKKLV